MLRLENKGKLDDLGLEIEIIIILTGDSSSRLIIQAAFSSFSA